MIKGKKKKSAPLLVWEFTKDCAQTGKKTVYPRFYMGNVFPFPRRLLVQRASFPGNPWGSPVLLSSEREEQQVWCPGYSAVSSLWSSELGKAQGRHLISTKVISNPKDPALSKTPHHLLKEAEFTCPINIYWATISACLVLSIEKPDVTKRSWHSRGMCRIWWLSGSLHLKLGFCGIFVFQITFFLPHKKQVPKSGFAPVHG